MVGDSMTMVYDVLITTSNEETFIPNFLEILKRRLRIFVENLEEMLLDSMVQLNYFNPVVWIYTQEIDYTANCASSTNFIQ